MSEARFRPGAYRKAAKIFYDHSAGCTPRSAVLEEIVDALLTPKEKAAPAMYEALKDVEWSANGACPQCGYGMHCGHQSRCILGNALLAVEGKR